MISKLYIPVFPLSQYIDHFNYHAGFYPEHVVDRYLPDGEVQLIFDLTDEPKYIYDNDTLEEIQSCRHVWFSGFRTKPITIPSGRESEMLVIQFKKGKAFPFVKTPMHALTNSVVDAELVFGAEIRMIRESLLEAKTPRDKFITLEHALLKRLSTKMNPSPLVDFTISRILTFPFQSSIKDISMKAGYSQKHIISLFKKQVGVTPKDFLKVIRFQRAVQHIEQQSFVNWNNVAYDCGFYDQSHFIADFKKFSGYTPTQYSKLKGDILNFIPIAE